MIHYQKKKITSPLDFLLVKYFSLHEQILHLSSKQG